MNGQDEGVAPTFVRATETQETTMSKTETGKIETGKIENVHSAHVLRDDELDVVSGGYSWGVSQTGTMGFAAPIPSSLYELLISG
jgi:hypothetical protein